MTILISDLKRYVNVGTKVGIPYHALITKLAITKFTFKTIHKHYTKYFYEICVLISNTPILVLRLHVQCLLMIHLTKSTKHIVVFNG